MRTRMTTVFLGLALLLPACIQVGPKDDEPIHVVLDVNIRIQVDEDVREVWDTVETLAEQAPVDISKEEG
jgi:hypothetical protein